MHSFSDVQKIKSNSDLLSEYSSTVVHMVSCRTMFFQNFVYIEIDTIGASS